MRRGAIRNLKIYTILARVDKVDVLVYPNTKIKLHLRFPILDDDRETCFRDKPHQCEKFANGEAVKVASGLNYDERIPKVEASSVLPVYIKSIFSYFESGPYI